MSLPFLADSRGSRLNRDLSHAALRSHARARSCHAPPLDLTDLYDVCGEANELVRNRRCKFDFAVAWLGDIPEGASSATQALTTEVAEEPSRPVMPRR